MTVAAFHSPKQKHPNLSSLVNETSAMNLWFAATATRQSRTDLSTAGYSLLKLFLIVRLGWTG